jgi:prepilin-type N-terminal cleavage/methylation domain-containing protein
VSLRRDGQAGLTLVEIMVTLVVASLVTTATFAFFAGQQSIYETQSKLLTTQQNLWASMDMVSRYLRSAGGGMVGCVRPDSDGSGPDPGDPGPGSTATPLTGLRAWRNGVGAFRIPPIWIQNGAGGLPDTLTVAYGNGATGTFIDATLGADVPSGTPLAAITTLAGQSARFFNNEFALLVDKGQANGDRGCSLFQITGIVAATNTLQHDLTGSQWDPGTNIAGVIPFTYPGGSALSTGGVRNFGQLVWVQFAINSTGSPGVPPRLTMNRLDGTNGPEVLAEGIEDMQIAYACDLQPAGVPDGVLSEGTDSATRLTDEWTYNEPLDVAQAGCNRPDAIRITLIARSLTPDDMLSGVPGNTKPAAEDGVAGSADQFRHRIATVSVYPRN